MRRRLYFLMILILLLDERLYAQEEQDAVLWTTISLEKKLRRNLSVQLTEEFRLRENLRRLNLFYTDLAINWKPTEWLRTSISYRNVQKYLSEEYFSIRHRLSWDVMVRRKQENFLLSYRHRLQAEIQDPGRHELGYLPEWYSRSRFEVKYLAKGRIQPYASLELRYQIKDPAIPEGNGLWHRNRYALGFQYEIDKKSSAGFYYLIQREFNVTERSQLYVLGLEYALQL